MKYGCPQCGSPVNAWADLDATVNFVISKSGKLIKQTITNNYQSDGRCGVECSECDWAVHREDIKAPHAHFKKLADDAMTRQGTMANLSVKRS
ncbi:hypothetical protein L3081_25080 [Colwellia sp. MSW7]|uniref:Uncharacterized protein n=1 Tax=Colwellia maritima TaxID=2912588 RepID=A0ABS9X795_9GAMM|nr:hypothetical protein [Colwellia maritima]MCI2286099.1 hypothetical protein [Colwellia maritima]